MSLPDKDGVESSCIDETDDAYKDRVQSSCFGRTNDAQSGNWRVQSGCGSETESK